MPCNFLWRELPKEIVKEVVEPLKDNLPVSSYKKYKNLLWRNLPLVLNDFFSELKSLFPECVTITKKDFIWRQLEEKASILCQIKDAILNCEPPIEYNFDIVADWDLDGSGYGVVTDEESFRVFLQNHGAFDITINAFNLEGKRLQANIDVNGLTRLELFTDIISVNKIGGFNNLIELYFVNNTQLTEFNPSIPLPNTLTILEIGSSPITEFNPSIPLPNSLTTLVLQNNQLTEFNPSIPLPDSLTFLGLGINQMTEFNPSIPLPNSLTTLFLDNNQLTEFNPSIPLPNSLTTLVLQNNQLTEFNPSIPLPDSLTVLNLRNNQMTEFNPSIPLPNSLTTLVLDNNQLTLSGYANSETWATNQPSFTNTCQVTFSGNIDSIFGTNLRTILLTKNCTVF